MHLQPLRPERSALLLRHTPVLFFRPTTRLRLSRPRSQRHRHRTSVERRRPLHVGDVRQLFGEPGEHLARPLLAELPRADESPLLRISGGLAPQTLPGPSRFRDGARHLDEFVIHDPDAGSRTPDNPLMRRAPPLDGRRVEACPSGATAVARGPGDGSGRPCAAGGAPPRGSSRRASCRCSWPSCESTVLPDGFLLPKPGIAPGPAAYQAAARLSSYMGEIGPVGFAPTISCPPDRRDD